MAVPGPGQWQCALSCPRCYCTGKGSVPNPLEAAVGCCCTQAWGLQLSGGCCGCAQVWNLRSCEGCHCCCALSWWGLSTGIMTASPRRLASTALLAVLLSSVITTAQTVASYLACGIMAIHLKHLAASVAPIMHLGHLTCHTAYITTDHSKA